MVVADEFAGLRSATIMFWYYESLCFRLACLRDDRFFVNCGCDVGCMRFVFRFVKPGAQLVNTIALMH